MKLFYIPTTDPNTIKNYKRTIKQRQNYKKEKLSEILPEPFSKNEFGLWGFKQGASNGIQYSKVESGDILLFRTRDEEGYQTFSGLAYVFDKVKNKSWSELAWDDSSYENIILVNKFVEFDEAFQLSFGTEKVASLTNVPSTVWHEGYNMFRQWTLYNEDGSVFSEEKFIEALLKEVPHTVKYNFLDDELIYERNNLNRILNDNSLNKTEKERLIKARVGQGKFRERLKKLDCSCKVCGLDEESLLIASHIKKWSKSNNKERLDKHNGYLLCPTHDSLFDKGFITFDSNGGIKISNLIDSKSWILLNIDENTKIEVKEEEKSYLTWHNKNVFRGNIN